jgi:predicted nucleic acid-binding protein
MIGVDTSLLIDFFDGDEDAVEWVESNKDLIFLSENVVYEFLCGDMSDEEVRTFLGFISHFEVLPFDRDASLKASKIYRAQKEKGKPVPHPDTMIAGCYLGHEIEKIATRNAEDFRKIDEVEVENYRES